MSSRLEFELKVFVNKGDCRCPHRNMGKSISEILTLFWEISPRLK